MRRLVLLLAGVVALAACGTDSAPHGPDVTGEWHLVSGTTLGADLAFPPGATATLALSGGAAKGTAFCNSFSATYALEGSSLSIGDIGRTEMGCEPEVTAAESTYLAGLDLVDTAVLDGHDLLLTGAGVELRFSRVVPVPDRPLAGTHWVLETLVDGETASSVLGAPTLDLMADSTAAFTTVCNGTTGTWRRDGDRLTLDPGPSTLVGCDPSVRAQDQQVVEVLTGGTALAIAGDRLTLTAPDGRGLVYRAG